MSNVLCVILGGGKGTRLYPLTRNRAKPAVPFGGRFRLVDIPISNCIYSNFREIYLLTQFNSSSLHMHINQTYRFDHFSSGFVEIMAASQTFEHESWYEGTADAVRQNLIHFRNRRPDYYMILSGDQLYKMDLRKFLQSHIDSGASITVASTPVTRQDADDLGILKIDDKNRIETFLEKPGPDRDIGEYRMPEKSIEHKNGEAPKEYLASMGIYIFSAAAMEESLDNDLTDFGKEVIPAAMEKAALNAYIYHGYWEDIGTIKNFYEANLNLASIQPNYNLYDEQQPIYTHRRDLPPSKLNGCMIKFGVTAEGSIITDAALNNSLIGIRTIINNGATLDGVYCMGADYYENEAELRENRELGRPDIGIGKMSLIKNAIIDKNVRIGNKCRIGVDQMERVDGDYENYSIKDGIIVIPKNKVIPAGTII